VFPWREQRAAGSTVVGMTTNLAIKTPTWALPISLFSIPLGLAGLGGAWTAAAQLLGAPSWPSSVAFGAATVIFVAFTLSYAAGTFRPGSGFHIDLRHPLLGPLTAYPPVIAILLIAHYAPALGALTPWLIWLAVLCLALNAAALFAHWLKHPMDRDAMHPGYFLPVTAGPFIAAIGFVSVGQDGAAAGVFGIGIFFWLLLGAVITARLFFGSELPLPFKPVLSILLSPPGTASVAWFAISHGAIDQLQAALGGVTLFMLLVQLFFVGDYLKLPFSTQYWVFTFPIAVLGNIGIRWASGLHFPGWQLVGWAVLTASTVLILGIVAASLRLGVRHLTPRWSTRTRAVTVSALD
jgi:tellurite resistance protein